MATTRNFNAHIEGNMLSLDLSSTAASVDALVSGSVVTWDTESVLPATGTSNKTIGLIAQRVIADPGTDEGFVKPIDPTLAYPGEKVSVYVDGGLYRYVMGMEDVDGNVVMPSGLAVGDVLDPHGSHGGCFVEGTAGAGQNVLKVVDVSTTEVICQLLPME